MNKELLREHIVKFLKKLNEEPEQLRSGQSERLERIKYYQSWTQEKMLSMSKADLLEYASKLWAMLIWGNKEYYVDQIIAKSGGIEKFRKNLVNLVWGKEDIEFRWDHDRKIKNGMGHAMRSEILCHTFPGNYCIWNRRAYIAFTYLGIKDLPRYNYQVTGKRYKQLCELSKEISREMQNSGANDSTLLAADYFLWSELQIEEEYSDQLHKEKIPTDVLKLSKEESEFIHNDVRDAIRDIGQWLGFKADIEKKVAEGSVVDAVWESQIGNMGRVIYVFEVQTKGSVDSLIVNLLKARNNPAVQGVVAVSDVVQLEKIKKHAAQVRDLGDFLKVWDYAEVLRVHESLEFVNASINKLNLVPEGF